MVKVIREPPSRRKHYRVTAPIGVSIDGTRYTTIDWSLGGFQIAEFHGTPPDDELPFEVTLHIPFQEFSIEANAQVEVRRFQKEEGILACEFIGMENRTRELLELFIKSVVAGHMVSIDGVIKSIDRPIDPIDTAVKPQIPPEVQQRRNIGNMVRAGVYVVLGLLLTGYIGNTVYRHLWLMEVSTAVILAPTEPIHAPLNGLFREQYVETGQPVLEGAPLFTIRNADLAARISAAELDLQQAELESLRKEAELELERSKLAIYQQIAESRQTTSEARVRVLSERSQLSLKGLERLRGLESSKAVAEAEVDLAEIEARKVEAELELASKQLVEDQRTLDAARQGWFFSGTRLEKGVRELEAESALANGQIAIRAQELAQLQQQQEQLTVRAPFSGRVVDVAQAIGTPVDTDRALMRIERDDQRIVEAKVNVFQARYIAIGDMASVDVPGLGQTYTARVSAIETYENATGATVLLTFAKDVMEGLVAVTKTPNDTLGETDQVAVVHFSRAWK